MNAIDDAELDDEVYGTKGQCPLVRDDMPPEATLRHTRDLNEMMARRTAKNAKKDGKDTKNSAIASTVYARGYGPSGAILMGGRYTGIGVSSTPKASEVSESSESWGMTLSPTSASVVANVPRHRDGSIGRRRS
jgi:hypothetical protein